MTVKVKCKKCNGDGWYPDHSDEHYRSGSNPDCSGHGCPVQRQCEICDGIGYHEQEEKK